LNRIAKEVGSRAKAFKHDKKLVRFFLPLEPKNSDDTVWSVIRTGKDTKRNPEDKYQEKFGQELTTYLRDIADENSLLKGIIDPCRLQRHHPRRAGSRRRSLEQSEKR
jgi:type I restriction enzyme M protein